MSLEDLIRQIAREEALQVVQESRRPAPDISAGVVSVPRAAELTDYRPDTIRKWIRAGRIKNYGRLGSPRVKVSEILHMEGR